MPRAPASPPTLRILAALALPVALAGGCTIERLFPDRVADGAARLAIRNVATLVGQVSDNEECGFNSPGVLENAIIDGEVGGRGTVTFTVTECVLDFGDELRVTDTNCNDIDTIARGQVVVNAVRVIEGRITGDPGTPVIPESSEAAFMQFDARFTDYEIRRSNSPAAITFKSGSLSYTVRPHLARSESLDVCAVAGANLTLEDVVLTDIVADVDSGDSTFETEISSATLQAQLGKWQETENMLRGSMTVWGTDVEVPIDGEFDGLDPDYETEDYFNSYACTDDLLLPVDYSCPDLTSRFAQGSAQLSVSAYATILQLIEGNEECGFASDQVKDNVELLGNVGEAGGQARYVITEPCAIDLPDNHIVSVDCNDKISFAEGRIWVTGTKTVSGIRTGDTVDPIVPTNRNPAQFSLSAEVENLKVFDSVSVNKLLLRSGTITGTARPQTGIDGETGACSIAIPVVTFENIRLENMDAMLTSEGKSFNVAIASARLDAQNGRLGERENYLGGEITVDGQQFPIPVSGDPILDPSYDPAVFASAFACKENLTVAASDADCSFMNILGDGAASLIVAAAGAVASKVNSNDSCGFEAYSVLLSPYLVEGEPGELGLMSWNIEDCTVGSDAIEQHELACNGARTMTGGHAYVDATRYVTGERQNMVFGLIDAIVPRDREAVTIELTHVDLEEFTVEPWAAGASHPLGTLTIHSGVLSGTVQPILGERESEPGTFDVPTPVAVLSDLTLTGAQATLQSEGKTFHLTLDDVELSAVNGTWNGQSNTISGQLRVNGELIVLEPQPLNDGFEQDDFDASYVCNDDLLEVIPSN